MEDKNANEGEEKKEKEIIQQKLNLNEIQQMPLNVNEPIQNAPNVNKNMNNMQQMQKAYEGSVTLFKKVAEKSLSEEERKILFESSKENDLIVVRGTYDFIERYFDVMGMKYLLVDPYQVQHLDLTPEKLVFVNCPGHIPAEGLRKLHSFVHSGGMLITTDWALKNVLENIFPNIVRYNEHPTKDDVVRVEFLLDKDEFFSKFIDETDEPVWWLEASSYPIEILNAEKVQVLIKSKELKEKYDEDPVLIRFEEGNGIIYHMISHFYLQRAETRDKRHEQEGVSFAAEKGVEVSESDKKLLSDVSTAEVEAAYTSQTVINKMIYEQRMRAKKIAKKIDIDSDDDKKK